MWLFGLCVCYVHVFDKALNKHHDEKNKLKKGKEGKREEGTRSKVVGARTHRGVC